MKILQYIRLVDYGHYILWGEAKSTEFSDDQSYLLVQKENSYYVFVGETEECWLLKIALSYDFGSQLYVDLDMCVGPSSQKYDQISFLARSPYCDCNENSKVVAQADLWVYKAANFCVSFFNQVASIFHLGGGKIKKIGAYLILIMSRESMHVWDNWIICPQIGWREFLPEHWSAAQAEDKLHKINTNTKHLFKTEISNF